jgi:hypothetical protein
VVGHAAADSGERTLLSPSAAPSGVVQGSALQDLRSQPPGRGPQGPDSQRAAFDLLRTNELFFVDDLDAAGVEALVEIARQGRVGRVMLHQLSWTKARCTGELVKRLADEGIATAAHLNVQLAFDVQPNDPRIHRGPDGRPVSFEGAYIWRAERLGPYVEELCGRARRFGMVGAYVDSVYADMNWPTCPDVEREVTLPVLLVARDLRPRWLQTCVSGQHAPVRAVAQVAPSFDWNNEQSVAENLARSIEGIRAKVIEGGGVQRPQLGWVQYAIPQRICTPEEARMVADHSIALDWPISAVILPQTLLDCPHRDVLLAELARAAEMRRALPPRR